MQVQVVGAAAGSGFPLQTFLIDGVLAVDAGALGWFDTLHDRGDLAVAIRTFTVAGGRTLLGVGGGVVADSDPVGEWDETCLKARRLLARTGEVVTTGTCLTPVAIAPGDRITADFGDFGGVDVAVF